MSTDPFADLPPMSDADFDLCAERLEFLQDEEAEWVTQLMIECRRARSALAALQPIGTDGTGDLLQGYLESSNVNSVTEIADLIAAQRAYEMNSKAIQTSDQMLQKLGQL